MNMSFGARNVSTVPTQALTLMNNEFVCGRPSCSRTGCRRKPATTSAKQIELAYGWR